MHWGGYSKVYSLNVLKANLAKFKIIPSTPILGFDLLVSFSRMYQDKLAHLKKQLQQLEDGTLPEFLKRKKKIEQHYKERLKVAEVFREYEVCILVQIKELLME